MMSSARQSPSAPARIHLRITHPQLNPGEITRTLAMSPEHTLEAGRSASSTGGERLHADCYWIAPLPLSSSDEPWLAAAAPESFVSALEVTSREALLSLALRRLQAHHTFFQRIGEDGGTVTLLLNLDQPGSLTIQPTLARKLADAGLGLELDWSGEVD